MELDRKHEKYISVNRQKKKGRSKVKEAWETGSDKQRIVYGNRELAECLKEVLWCRNRKRKEGYDGKNKGSALSETVERG
ncbi:hypothetical protein D7X88_10925 [bacterium C-53]|nr:hypothetical protein [Lachnospiraceae bacterium]NBI03548.1 hypothetical protein [Lachnospiraceae bacterium]RKJ09546.1 hypothetical protein D7X88_10925 [bacterium C-53]